MWPTDDRSLSDGAPPGETVDTVAPGVARVRPASFAPLAAPTGASPGPSQSPGDTRPSRQDARGGSDQESAIQRERGRAAGSAASRLSLMPSALRAYLPGDSGSTPAAGTGGDSTPRRTTMPPPRQTASPDTDAQMAERLAPLRGISRELVARGMPSSLVTDLLSTIVAEYGSQVLESERDARLALVDELLQRIPERPLIPENGPLVGAFVITGPAGSGKSVLLSHLALAAARRGQRDVVLVNTESARIGAAAGMNAIGEVFGFPVEHIYTPQDLRSSRSSYGRDALFLIETAGWTPDLPGEATPTPWRWRLSGATVVACIPATGQGSDLHDLITATRDVAADAIATLCKVDATRNVLPALGALAASRQPVGMVVPGPNLAIEAAPRSLGDVARAALGVVLPRPRRGRVR